MFDFLFFPGGTDPSVVCRQPSVLMPGQEAIRQGVSLRIFARHWGTTSVSFSMIEEIPKVEEIDGVLHQRDMWVKGPEGAPPTTWEIITKSIDDCRLIEMAMALVEGEVHGKTRERFIYNLIWASLRDNPATHPWMREHFPDWFEQIEEALTKNKQT